MSTEHGRGEDGNFIQMWDEVNHCVEGCKRTEGAQTMMGVFFFRPNVYGEFM